jgi:hypothetical protein
MPDRKNDDDALTPERPDDARGAHNRLGFLDVDESDSSSERGAEEPEVETEIERPD